MFNLSVCPLVTKWLQQLPQSCPHATLQARVSKDCQWHHLLLLSIYKKEKNFLRSPWQICLMLHWLESWQGPISKPITGKNSEMTMTGLRLIKIYPWVRERPAFLEHSVSWYLNKIRGFFSKEELSLEGKWVSAGIRKLFSFTVSLYRLCQHKRPKHAGKTGQWNGCHCAGHGDGPFSNGWKRVPSWSLRPRTSAAVLSVGLGSWVSLT